MYDITCDTKAATTELFDQVRGCVYLILPARGGDDVGTGFCKAEGHRQPDAGGTTNDYCDLARQIKEWMTHWRRPRPFL